MSSINSMQKRYKCSKCEVEFGHLSHAKNHIKRKTTCKLNDLSIATIIHIPLQTRKLIKQQSDTKKLNDKKEDNDSF